MRPSATQAALLALLLLAFAAVHGPAQPLAPEINLDDIRARAERNDPQAQTTLGTFYQLGQAGLKADFKEAMKWLQRAAQQGDPSAMYRVGYMYYGGQGVTQSVPEAIRWFKKSAESGFAIAQYTLGNLFAEGRSLQLNYSEALRWHYYAAEQGYAPAQHQVGAFIFQGKGAPQDYFEGCKWLYIASYNGSEPAREAITTIALPLMKRDDMEKASELALAFKPKPPRIVSDKAEPPHVFNELLTKANAGDPVAQWQLALLLQTGAPTTDDLKEARKWIQQAASGGHAEAQHQLGSMYFLGHGMVKDYVAAYKWLSLSVSQGWTNAVEGRDKVTAAMTPFQLTEARRQLAAFPTGGTAKGKPAQAPPTSQPPVPTVAKADQSSLPPTPKATTSPAVSAPPVPATPTTPSPNQPATTVVNPRPPLPGTGETAKTTPTPAPAPAPGIEQLRRDAGQGRAEAQLSLGLVLLHGKGVPANRVEAVQWLEKAANQGHSPAQFWLATTFDAAHQADRVKWMRRAADGGFGLAQFTLGQMYFSAQGVVQDVIEAYKWLHLASRQGNAAADAFLETVAPVMSAEQIEEAKRRAEEIAFRLKTVPGK